MQADVLATLVRRRPEIRRAWEILLRAERASTPMANPDTLVFMMDWTLDRIFADLRVTKGFPASGPARTECACGLNPMLVYFSALRQVLTEALVLAQAARPEEEASRREAELAQVTRVVDEEAEREITAFCSVCLRRESGRRAAVNPLTVGGGGFAGDAAEDAVELGE